MVEPGGARTSCPSRPRRTGGRLTRLDLASWLVAGEPADGPGLRQPALEAVLRHRHQQPGRRPRRPGRVAGPSRAARLAGRRVPRRRLGRQAHGQADGDVGDLPPGLAARPELREIDPNNRLLAFQSPRRLEAEFVRDNALAIAGLLNLDIGGPSVYPYQPAGYYANIQFPDRDYVADRDDRQYRRGVYMHWQRTFLHPMLANFDAPAARNAPPPAPSPTRRSRP